MINKTYIVQNLNYAAPYPGNLMRSIWNLEQKCKEDNIEFIYCFPEVARHLTWIEEMSEQGSIVYFKPSKNSLAIWRKIIKKYRPLAIHTHFWNIRDSIMIKFSKLFDRKIHLILHHHNTYFESKKCWKELLKRIIIKSDIHIACGVSVGDNLKISGFENVVTVENAIDFSRLDNYTPIARKNFDISDDAVVFLMFGYASFRKGVDIAIKAIKDLEQEEKVLCIAISNNLENVIQKLCTEFGEIPAWVRFLPPRDDIATYYRFADVFLSPSREEGFCYALPEAVYCGCQIVFSDIEGQRHAADIPGSLSFISENIESLKKQIQFALEDIDRDKITARDYVYNRYDLAKWSEAIEKIYIENL